MAMPSETTSTHDYLAAHHVFTIGEFESALAAGSSSAAAKHRLDHAEGRGWVERVMRGVYVSRVGMFAKRQPDAFVLASKLGRDAVISHASALVALGLSHNVLRRVTFSSTSKPTRRTFGDYEFVRLQMPRALAEQPALDRHTVTQRTDDGAVRVTARERTLVDCLAQPAWSGGLESLLRSVGGVPSWRVDDLLDYLDLVGSPSVVARTAWVLTADPDRRHLEGGAAESLRERMGLGPYYLGDRGRAMRFVSRWRLYVPADAEPAEWLNG
jgi:predicted transcriptional regulator of viral defense system